MTENRLLRFGCNDIKTPKLCNYLKVVFKESSEETTTDLRSYLENEIKENEEKILDLMKQRKAHKRPTKFSERVIRDLLS
jgi:hypothetical protein